MISEFDHWLSRSWLAVDVRFMCTEALKSSDAVLPRQEMKSTGNDDFQLDLHEDQKVALMFCKLFGFILKKRDFIFGKFGFFFFFGRCYSNSHCITINLSVNHIKNF